MHKHCNLDKWQIWKYTLPQVVELMTSCNRYIQFETEMKMGAQFPMLGGSLGGGTPTESDEEFEVMDAEGLNLLTTALGGG